MKKGVVYLVGAGPGNPSLLTLRARHVLERADVVLYDALVHRAILRHAPPSATLEFVGKRAGGIYEKQTTINRKLVDAALAGRTVVRLKGGDPYLYGRGTEEAEALVEAGVSFEVVPGVPSPIGAAAYAGVSLTHRDFSSSVAFVTAIESPNKTHSFHDWEKLATATDTLVIFMGRKKLRELVGHLLQHGRVASTPVAAVSSATLASQRVVVGTLADIAEKVEAADLPTPALTIVGEVARLHETLAWYEKLPLFGKRVLVGRPEGQSDELCDLLWELGAEPCPVASIRITRIDPNPSLVAAVRELGSYDWIIFTSVNSVHFVFEALAAQGLDARAFASARICAIGNTTSRALAERGLRADAVPAKFQGEEVLSAIRNHPSHHGKVPGSFAPRVLLPRAEKGREVIVESLRSEGATVTVLPVYRTDRATDDERNELLRLVTSGRIDVVTFSSGSTVDAMLDVFPDARTMAGSLAPFVVACIGPVTAHRCRELGVRVDVVAAEASAKGLVDSLVGHFSHAHSSVP